MDCFHITSCGAESLGRSLVETDVDGLYSDILRQLLAAIFHLQEEELKEEEVTGKDLKGWLSDDCLSFYFHFTSETSVDYERKRLYFLGY